MEISTKPPINPVTSENLKKPDEKEVRKEKKSEESRQPTASGPAPDYRVKLSKESLNAAARLGVEENAAGAANAEKGGDNEEALKKIAGAAGQQLAGMNYGLTTSSSQKLFETFV